MLKIALIGCGEIVRVGHGPALRRLTQQDPAICLAACADTRPEAADACAEAFGFEKTYTDYREMLAAEKPDAVFLAVPVRLTCAVAIDLLEAGIPVLLEKPPGIDLSETNRMIEAASSSGTPHQVAFNRRHMPVIRRFRELAAGGSSDAPRFQTWEYEFYRVGCIDSHYETTAIHAIDTLRFLAGSDYVSVEFSYTPARAEKDYVPAIWMDCVFENGARGRITVQPATGLCMGRVTAHGTNELLYGALPFYTAGGSIDGPGRILYAKDRKVVLEEKEQDAPSDVLNGYYDEDRRFIECIRAGERPKDDLASTLQSMEVAECIFRRAKEYHRR